MAIIDKSKTVAKLSSKIELPRDHYVLRCTSEKFAPSQKGNPMITREWEIVSPESKEINGQQVIVAGTKLLQYLTVKVSDGEGGWDADKTAAVQARLVQDYDNLGFDSNQIDDENPALHAEGVYADAICASEKYTQRKVPTPEQRAANQQGDEILIDGKKLESFKPTLVQIVGRATVEGTGRGF